MKNCGQLFSIALAWQGDMDSQAVWTFTLMAMNRRGSVVSRMPSKKMGR